MDSSIGGKTGIDFMQYKNMVGAFYQPKLVYMNLSVLHSLPGKQIVSGMGEIIKHGLIKDASYFEWLIAHEKEIWALDPEILEEMIYISCNIKRDVVERDPKEQGERALLNFGHTIGHAIEKLSDFSLYHGECVGLGIVAASLICPCSLAIFQKKILRKYKMLYRFLNFQHRWMDLTQKKFFPQQNPIKKWLETRLSLFC